MTGCTLVKKHPAGRLLWYTVPCLHLLSPTAHSIYYATMLKPKQAKAGQNELTSCPQPIQPLNGGNTHALPELNKFGLVWTVQWLQQVSRARDACVPFSSVFAA